MISNMTQHRAAVYAVCSMRVLRSSSRPHHCDTVVLFNICYAHSKPWAVFWKLGFSLTSLRRSRVQLAYYRPSQPCHKCIILVMWSDHLTGTGASSYPKYWGETPLIRSLSSFVIRTMRNISKYQKYEIHPHWLRYECQFSQINLWLDKNLAEFMIYFHVLAQQSSLPGINWSRAGRLW